MFFLTSLATELVSDIHAGQWEKYPHQCFYSPLSRFGLVKRPAMRRTTTKVIAGSTDAGSIPAGSIDRTHQHGVCMWYVAGQLNMKAKSNGRPYQCNDLARKHGELKSVPIGTMRELLKDPTFMTCKTDSIKRELIAQVEAHKSRFGK